MCACVFPPFLTPMALPFQPFSALQDDGEAAADELLRLSGHVAPNGGSSRRDGASAAAAAGGGGAGEQGAPGGRTILSFSRPSRAVVTFALFRSAATAELTGLTGSFNETRLWQKRLYEVEALEHNTLQEVMGGFRFVGAFCKNARWVAPTFS